MTRAIRNYFVFLKRCAGVALEGDWRYYAWMGLLAAICLLGLNAYCRQFAHGLIVTGMSDEVSWGVYIANFTFLVGVAAAAVMMVIPVYIYKNEDLHDLVIFGELLAVAAILMCLAFVTVDLGRPDRFWHLIPGIGQFNFPKSMLSWDVLVLNGYLLLNVIYAAICSTAAIGRPNPANGFTFRSFSSPSSGLSRSTPSRRFSTWVWAGGLFGILRLWAPFPGLRLYGGAGSHHPGHASRPARHLFLFSRPAGSPAAGLRLCRRSNAAPPLWTTFALLTRYLPEMASVPMETAGVILPMTEVLEVEPGDALLRQGKPGTGPSLSCAAPWWSNREEGGRFRITRTAGPGEQFGEISALNATPRTATAFAEEPSLVLSLSADALRLLMQSPQSTKSSGRECPSGS
jgi:hypothetical protein